MLYIILAVFFGCHLFINTIYYFAQHLKAVRISTLLNLKTNLAKCELAVL